MNLTSLETYAVKELVEQLEKKTIGEQVTLDGEDYMGAGALWKELIDYCDYVPANVTGLDPSRTSVRFARVHDGEYTAMQVALKSDAEMFDEDEKATAWKLYSLAMGEDAGTVFVRTGAEQSSPWFRPQPNIYLDVNLFELGTVIDELDKLVKGGNITTALIGEDDIDP